jgi:hypothetical protein
MCRSLGVAAGMGIVMLHAARSGASSRMHVIPVAAPPAVQRVDAKERARVLEDVGGRSAVEPADHLVASRATSRS